MHVQHRKQRTQRADETNDDDAQSRESHPLGPPEYGVGKHATACVTDDPGEKYRGGKVTSSSEVIAGWSLGSSRKYQTQIKTQTRLTAPSTIKEPRHVSDMMSAATIGGAAALPKRAEEWVMPWAKPRLSGFVHDCIARVAVGNVAPSPKPSSTR